MNCKKNMEKFLNYDKEFAIPWTIRLHMFFCPQCRDEINSILYEITSLQETSAYEMDVDLSDSIMQKVYKSNVNYEHTMSNLKWLCSGSLILSSIVLISFSDSFIYLKKHFGGHLEIPISIVLSLIFCGYLVLFIGSHLEGLKENVDYYLKKINLF